MLVDGVTKLDKVTYGDAAQAETVRKMVVAMARDIRVLVIKLADRLHNARTWRYVSAGAAAEGPRDAGDLRPAGPPPGHEHHQVGAGGPRLRHPLPQDVRRDRAPGAERAPAREEYLAGVRRGGPVRPARRPGSRRRSPAGPSTTTRLPEDDRPRPRLRGDLRPRRIRVLVDTVRDCYAALGTLHARWNPVPGRFKDYIAMPKFNMYQSLHTTVIGPEGKRSRCRSGPTTCTGGPSTASPPTGSTRRRQRRRRGGAGATPRAGQRHGLAAPAPRLAEGDLGPGRVPGLAAVRPLAHEVFVFTPKGYGDRAARRRHPGGLRLRGPHRGRPPLHRRPRQRPPGAAGEHAGQRRPGGGLHLQGGRRRASRDWLGFVKCPGPGTRSAVVLQGAPRRGDRARQGRHRPGHAQAGPADPAHHDRRSLPNLARELRYPDISALYAAVGEGHVAAQDVVQKLVASIGGEEGASEDIAESSLPSRGASRRPQRRPGCGRRGRLTMSGSSWPAAAPRCPATRSSASSPGARRLGAPRRLHQRVGAVQAARQADRGRVGAGRSDSVFLVAIQVEALDRPRLLSDVTRILSDQHVNILSALVDTSRDRVAITQVHLRDGRPQAPRPRAQGGPRRSRASSTSTGSRAANGSGTRPGCSAPTSSDA